MKALFSAFILCVFYFTAHAAPGAYILDGGHLVGAHWSTNFATQEDYSRATSEPQLVGYTVYLELGCKLTRITDGTTSYIMYPGIGISGHCDMVNDTECSVDIAKNRAHENWQRNAEFLCWTQYNQNWDVNKSNSHYPN